MGAAQQLGLILWKNIILRIRQPGILFLELIWPVAIFVVVALVRQATPPEDRHQCHYAPRSMPSAGGFAFLQSFACNLDNYCYPDEESSRKSMSSDATAEFLKSSEILFKDPDKARELMQDLPQIMEVLNKLQDSLESPEMQEIINTEMTLGNFLRDPNAVKRQLVDKMALLPEDVVDALLDSTTNVTQLYKLTGYVDFKNIVCDPEELVEFLALPPGVSPEVLSAQLCDLDSKKIPDLVKVIQNELDVAAIVKLISKVTGATGDYDSQKMFQDIATMVEVFQNTSLASDLFMGTNMFLDLQESAHWVLDVVTYLQNIMASSSRTELDINGLQALVWSLDPIIEGLAGNATWWTDLNTNLAQIFAVLDYMNDVNSNVSDTEKTLRTMFGQNAFSDLLVWMQEDLNLTHSIIDTLFATSMDMNKLSGFIGDVSKPGADIMKMLCVYPGLVSLYKIPATDRDTRQQLQDIQAALCALNTSVAEENIMNMFDTAKLMQELQDIKNGQFSDSMQKLNWTSLYETGQDLYKNMERLIEWIAPLLDSPSFSMQSVWDNIGSSILDWQAANMTSFSDITAMITQYSWLSSLGSWESDNRLLVVSASYLVDIMEVTAGNTAALGPAFIDLLENNVDVRRFLGQILTTEEANMEAIISVLTNQQTIQLLQKNPAKFFDQIACNITFLEQLMGRNSEADVVVIEGLLCNRNLTNVLQTIVATFQTEEVQQIAGELEAIWSGTVDISEPKYDQRANMTAVIERSLQVIDRIIKTGVDINDWERVKDVLEAEGIKADAEEFYRFIGSLQANLPYNIGKVLVSDLGPVLETSPLWPTIGPLIQGMLTMVETNDELQMYLIDTLEGRSETGKILHAILNYGPDYMTVIGKALQDSDFLKQLTTLAVSFCDPSFDNKDLDPLLRSAAMEELRALVCAGNFTQLEAEIQIIIDAYYIQSELLYNLLMFNFTAEPIEWDEAYISMYNFIQSYVTNEFWNSMEPLFAFDMTRFENAVHQIIRVFQNQTLEDTLTSVLHNVVPIMEMMDQAILGEDNEVWNVVHALADAGSRAMKAATNMINGLFDNEVRLEEIVMGSDELRTFILKQADVMPELLTAVKSTMVHPEEMLKAMMSVDMTQKSFCNGLSLKDFMTFDNEAAITEYEDLLCNMNMEVVMQQIAQSPNMQDIMQFYMINITAASQTRIPVNWTEVVLNYEAYLAIYSKPWSMDDIRFLPDVPGFNLTELTDLMTEIMDVFQGMNLSSLNQLYSVVDDLGPWLDKLLNDSASELDLTVIQSSINVQNSFMSFMNKQFAKMIGKNVSITDLLVSEELNKILDARESNPDILKIILNTIISGILDPNKAAKLTAYGSEFALACNDSAIFEKIFSTPGDSGINYTQVQHLICSTLDVDANKLWQELVNNTDGLADYINTINNGWSHPMNITAYIENQMLYQRLLEEIISNPPTFLWNDLTSWFDMVDWDNIFQTFLEQAELATKNRSLEDLGNIDITSLLAMFANSETMNQYNAILVALINQLEPLVGKNITLDDLVSDAPESQKLVVYLRQLPVLYEVLVTTALYDSSKLSPLYTGDIMIVLCTGNLDDIFTISPAIRQQFIDMVTGICQLNFTIITSELSDKYMPGLLQNVTYPPVNETTFQANLMRMNQLFMELIADSSWAEDYSWLYDYDWMALFNQTQIDYTKQEAWTKVLNDMLPQLQDMVDSLNMSMISDFDSILNQIAAAMEAANYYQDPMQLFEGLPRMQELMTIQKNLPEILATISLSALNQEKFLPLQAALTGNYSAVCQMEDIQQYLTLGPNVTLDFNAIKDTLCDFTALQRETIIFAGRYYTQPGTHEINLTATAIRVQNAQKILESTISGSNGITTDFLPWLQAEAWDKAFASVFSTLAEPIEPDALFGYSRYVEILRIIDVYVGGALNEMNVALNLNQAVFSAMTKIMDRLANRTFLLSELLTDLPETTKLLVLFNENLPDIIDVMYASYDTPQFQKLLSYNVTIAIYELCYSPLDVAYLTAPAHIDLRALINSFCQVNFTLLEQENTDADFLGILNIVQQTSNMAPVNYTENILVYTRFTASLERFMADPPVLLMEGKLYNESVWIDLAMRLNSQQSDPTLQALYSYERLLNELDAAGLQNVTMAMHSFVSTLIKSLGSSLENLPATNISFADLTGDDSLLLNYIFAGYQVPVTITQAFLRSPINKTSELATFLTNLMQSPDPSGYFCNYTLANFVDMFEVPPGVDISVFLSLGCDVNDTQFDEVLRFLGIDDVIRKLEVAASSKNYSALAVNRTEFLADLQKLAAEIQELIQNGNNFVEIDMDIELINNLISQLLNTYGDFSDVQNIMKIVQQLLAITDKTSDGQSIMNRYFHTSELILGYFTDLIKSVEIQRGSLRLASLFGNTTDWLSLLQTGFNIAPELAQDLASVDIKLNKLGELVSLNEAQVTALLCSSSLLEEYFTFPASVDVDSVTNALCALNATVLMQEFEDVFGFNKLLEQLNIAWKNLDTVDMKEFEKSYTDFVNEILKLMNVTEVDLFGRKQWELTQLNMSAPWPQIFDTLTGIGQMDPASISDYAGYLEQFDTMLQGDASWTEMKAYLSAVSMFMDLLTGKIQQWPLVNLTMADVLANATRTAEYVRETFQVAPEVIHALFNAEIDWEQFLASPDPAYLCSDGVVYPDGVDVDAVKQAVCDMNFTLLVQELANDWNWSIIRQRFMEASAGGNYQLNWTDYMDNAVRLQDAINQFFTSADLPSPEVFFQYNGDLGAWLDRLVQAFSLPQSLPSNGTQNWLDMVLSGLYNGLSAVIDVSDPVASEIIKANTELIRIIHAWLQQTLSDGEISLADLVGNGTDASTILQSVLNLDPEIVEALANAELSQDLLLSLLTGSSSYQTIFCNSTLLSENLKLSPGASVSLDDLQVALCGLNLTKLSEELYQIWDVSKLIEQFTRLWESPEAINGTTTEKADLKALFGGYGDLIELFFALLEQPPSLQEFNFSDYISLMEKFMQKDMSALVIQGVKSVLVSGVSSVAAQLDGDTRSQLGAFLDITNNNFQVIVDAGLSNDDLVSNSTALAIIFNRMLENSIPAGNMNVSLPPYSTAEVEAALREMVDFYDTLTSRGYLSTTMDIDPMVLLGVLQEYDVWSYLIEQLSGGSGSGEPDPMWDVLHTVTTVMQYFNKLMEDAKEGGGSIKLESLVPDMDALRRLLDTALQPDSTDILLLASIKPDFITKITNQTVFVNMVCDPDKISELFDLPADLSPESIALLQTELCAAARNKSLLLQQIMSLMDVNMYYTEILASLAGGRTGNPWPEYMRQAQLAANNMISLFSQGENSTHWLMDWFSALQGLLPDYSNPNDVASGYLSSCDKGLELLERMYPGQFDYSYLLMSQFYMESSLLSMEAISEMEDLVCMMPSLNLTDLMDAFNSSKAVQLYHLYVDALEGKFRNSNFSCGTYMTLVEQTIEAFNSTLSWGQGWNRIIQCLEENQGKIIPALTEIDSILGLLREGKSLLENTPELANMIGEDMLSTISIIINGLFQQQPSFMSLEKLWLNSSTIEEALSEILNLSPEVLRQILASSIDINLLPLVNVTEGTISDLLCDPRALEDLLKLPPQLGFNMSLITDQLCGDNLNKTLQLFKDSLNLGNILTEVLNNVPEYGFTTDWLSDLITNFDNLVMDMSALFELSDLLQDFQNIDLVEILGALEGFQNLDAPNKIFDDIQNIIKSIRSVMSSDEADKYLLDLEKIANGIRGLNLLKNLDFNQPIHEILRDASVLRKFMIDQLGLTGDVADAVLNATLKFEELADLSDLDIPGTVCDPEQLALLLTFTNTSNVTYISSTLCQLSQEEIISIFDYLVKELEIGTFMEDFINIRPETVLAKANVTKEELKKITDAFQPFKGEFQNVIKGSSELSKELNLSANSIISGEQQAASALNSMSTALCGRDSAFEIEDSYNVGDNLAPDENSEQRRKKRATKDDELTDYDRQQLRELESAFCKDLYMTVIDSEYGRIIWSYLKPLLRGKILYAPITDETTAIMVEATTLFRDITKLQQLTKSMSESLNTIGVENRMNNFTTLKNALGNPFISGAVAESLGFSAGSMLNDLEGLDDLDVETAKMIVMLADMAYNMTECMEKERLQAYDSEDSLEVEAGKLAEGNNIFAGVYFMNIDGSSRRKRQANGTSSKHNLPKHIKYKIRMDIENVQRTDDLKTMLWRARPEDNFATDLRYLRGFMQIQDMIDGAIVKLQGGDDVQMPSVQLQHLPFPCHRRDDFQLYISTYFFPIVMVLAWLVAIASAISSIVYDKEKGLEETMKIMGLRSGVNWFAWFFNTFLGMLLVSFLLVVILKVGKLMPESNPVFLFVFLAAFSLSMVMFCYMISTFFHRTTIASLSGVMAYLISYLPYVILVSMSVQLLFWHTVLLCLSATTAFSLGGQLIAHMEEKGVGLQWSNAQDYDFGVDWCIYMMLIDSAIYGLIGWYIRNVFPGHFGVSQHCCFPFMPSYWNCCRRKKSNPNKHKTGKNGKITDDTLAPGEPEPSHLPLGIAIHNLRKEFTKRCPNRKIVAVDDLNVNFYRDQITAFLGKNGSGKTTTINMLTGFYESTSGTAYIEGRNIYSDVNTIRQELGICTQQDVLFENLTVYEHLDMFVNLKSTASKKEKKAEIYRMLDSSGLQDSRHVRVSKLSGGQRRRLCVLLAFIGGSKVIILDEPTSGVDPSARRAIWDMISQHKEGRTILLSTHHMDEADILGDRVVMLHKGKLVCSGSPLYLKSHYGSGYHLTLSKDMNTPPKLALNDSVSSGTKNSNSTEVLKFVQQHVVDAYISEEIGSEIKIVLPSNQGQTAIFHQLFAHLDSNLDNLGISSYGVTDTSLEEVFLKFVRQSEKNLPGEEKSSSWKGVIDDTIIRDSGVASSDSPRSSSQASTSKITMSETNSSSRSSVTSTRLTTKDRVTGGGLVLLQFGALFAKRVHHHKRDLKSYLSQIILPVLFMILAMGVSKIKPNTEDMPPLLLTPALYSPDQIMFFRMMDPIPQNLMFQDALLSPPGVSTVCMDDSDHKQLCEGTFSTAFKTDSIPDKSWDKYLNPEPCECKGNHEDCPEGSGGRPLPYKMTRYGDRIYNITASPFGTEEYLLRTNTESQISRFGGWEFGSDNGTAEGTVWWNNKAWHALPSFYNAYSNMVLRSAVANSSERANYGISVYNHPLKLSKEQLSQQLLMSGIAETGIALTILCAFCFVPAGYTIYLIQERITREKRLQFLCGVGLGLYWFTALIWDMLAYIFTTGLAVIVTVLFDISAYNARLNLPGFVVLLVMFGWATIPFMYLFVRRFKTAATGYMTMFVVNLLIGLLTTACVFLLSLFTHNDKIKLAHEILSAIFLIFPQFCLGDGLIRLSRNQFLAEINIRFHIDSYVSPFSYEALFWHFIAMAIEGFCFLILNFIIESRPCTKSTKTSLASSAVRSGLDSINRSRMDPSYMEDEDVSRERQRVMTGEARDDLVVLYNLKKVFKKAGKRVTAVDNLTLGVPRGECFGLLGVNGAGKTTTFHMMTGEEIPSAGAALLEAKIISENLPQMKQKVGYCPQVDALDPYMTVTEVLYLFGKLKGLAYPGIKAVVESAMETLALKPFANKTVKTLSGGTRRKLSVAVALLGEPDAILMDEPTTGMDPQTRRLVWNTITNVIRDNRSVILTSHSMEECEALCTRLSIMVNGRFQCLGNGQHLKHRFGNGYTVKIKTVQQITDMTQVVNFMLDTFPRVTVKDQHMNVVEFEVPHRTARLSDIFGSLEGARSLLGIQDYSVAQTSLDQVFIDFSRNQTDDRTDNGDEDITGTPVSMATDPNTQGYVNPGYEKWGQSLGTKSMKLDMKPGAESDLVNNQDNVFVVNGGQVNNGDHVVRL